MRQIKRLNRQATMFEAEMFLCITPVEVTLEKQAELKRALADLLMNAALSLPQIEEEDL
jgi:hypothetical protein